MPSGSSAVHVETAELRPQPWRWGHPRVLVEHPDEATGLAIASGLRYAGYAVSICPGPAGHGECALLGPEGCAPAHDADLVVCGLGYERGTAREILRELRLRYPKVPLLVEAPPELDDELRELLDGCAQLAAPATPEQIVASVQSLIGQPAQEGPRGA
jgi:DNA-binding response OmpR family regulator